MESDEVWMNIPGFEGKYAVSNRGRVKSLPRVLSSGGYRAGCYLSGRICPTRRYPQVQLWDGTRHTSLYVHRLVAKAFIPNLERLPEVNHKDRDPTNNDVSNLEWVTSQRNSEHVHAKRYLLKDGDSTLYTYNLRKYCRDNNLDRNQVKKLILARY